MQFCEYVTAYTAAKSLGLKTDSESFYKEILQFGISSLEGTDLEGFPFEFKQFLMEYAWVKARRPYYNVWPSIIPYLLKLKLDFDSGTIDLPMDVICVRLPEADHPLKFEWHGTTQKIRTMMVNRSTVRGIKGISIWMDIGEFIAGGPVYTFQNIQCDSGRTLEDSLKNLPRHDSANVGIVIPPDIVENCVRLCCTLCLLEQDASIIEPDVLSDDQRKYEETGDQKYVDKAHRRGKIGWHIGRNLQVAPHVRGPSPAALYWTGKGKAIPKIRFRAGCIVHRKKIEHLPTGFMGKEDEDVS